MKFFGAPTTEIVAPKGQTWSISPPGSLSARERYRRDRAKEMVDFLGSEHEAYLAVEALIHRHTLKDADLSEAERERRILEQAGRLAFAWFTADREAGDLSHLEMEIGFIVDIGITVETLKAAQGQ